MTGARVRSNNVAGLIWPIADLLRGDHRQEGFASRTSPDAIAPDDRPSSGGDQARTLEPTERHPRRSAASTAGRSVVWSGYAVTHSRGRCR